MEFAQGGWTDRHEGIAAMDMRFGLTHMAAPNMIMDAQRDGCEKHPDPTQSHWPSLGQMRGEAPKRRVNHRAVGWRALSGIAAVWHLLPARRQV